MSATETEAEGPRPIVRVDHVTKVFPVSAGLFSSAKRFVRALDDVSFYVRRGETLGLVGESGCGKSTLGRVTVKLLEATTGRIQIDGTDVTHFRASEMRPLRKRVQIVFQDPFSSLDPRMTIKDIVGEGLSIHGLAKNRAEHDDKVRGLLARVGLRTDAMDRFPHEFSGGQRQRIGIARALAVGPEFIVCDEPLSALDVSIQAQVVNLLTELQEDLNLSYLLISHDLKVVEFMSHRVAVMYLGRIVEVARVADLYEQRLHPYTRALMSAIPTPTPGKKRLRMVLEGDVPSPLDVPKGCPFHPRCPKAQRGTCDVETPALEETTKGSHHYVACFFPGE